MELSGWTPPARILSIVIEDGICAGARLRTRSVPVGVFLDLLDASTSTAPGDTLRFLREFAGRVVEWNVPDTPCTPEAVLALDTAVAMELAVRWLGAVGGTDEPSDPPPPGLASASVPTPG